MGTKIKFGDKFITLPRHHYSHRDGEMAMIMNARSNRWRRKNKVGRKTRRAQRLAK